MKSLRKVNGKINRKQKKVNNISIAEILLKDDYYNRKKTSLLVLK